MSREQSADALTRQTLGGAVVERLREAIVAGEILPDSPLAEPELAARFGVSRGPIREALMEVVRDGLAVEDRRGRVRVVTLQSRDYEEILSLRVALEGLAAELAAQRGTEADWQAMAGTLLQFAVETSVDRLARLDVEFHERIVAAARHQRLLVNWQGLKWPFLALLVRIYREYAKKTESGDAKVSQASHQEILVALQSGNSEVAKRLVQAHIRHWREWNPTLEN